MFVESVTVPVCDDPDVPIDPVDPVVPDVPGDSGPLYSLPNAGLGRIVLINGL